jgi:Rod binding domain-containing protein
MELGTVQTDKLLKLAQQQHSIARLQDKADTLKMVAPDAAGQKVPGSTLSEAEMKHIDQAAQDFEAMFLTEMMRPMFDEVNKPDPMFGGGKGEEVFNNLMLDEYGKKMAASGGIGLASHVKAEMIRLQEAKHGQ